MNENFDYYLNKLSKSSFRTKFSLKKSDMEYIDKKGMDIIEKHAYELIEKRLVSERIENDGKQTPMRGHPVFIAQHATATCCRGCLFKWYHIDKNRKLSKEEVDFVVGLIMTWIENQINLTKNRF